MPEPEEIDAQLKLIAKMLVEARAPLIYGLTQLTVEAQELAVELAMCLRGAIDTPHGSRIPARGTSLQLHGEARATQGEIRQYADLLVLIGVGKNGFTQKMARTFTFAPMVAPCGKGADLLTPDAAQKLLELGTRNDEELQALRQKMSFQPPTDAYWHETIHLWHGAKYPVLIYDPQYLHEQLGPTEAAWVIEQIELTVLLRAKFGRAAAWPIDFGSDELNYPTALSNAAGAEYVLTARTGYPAAVQCFSGCGEFLPGVTNAETLLADGVIDAALFLGEGPSAQWTAEATQHLQNIPTAIIASNEAMQELACQYHIACCSLSEEQGTIVREDGVPIPLKPSAAPVASAEKILRQLLALVRETAAASGAAR